MKSSICCSVNLPPHIMKPSLIGKENQMLAGSCSCNCCTMWFQFQQFCGISCWWFWNPSLLFKASEEFLRRLFKCDTEFFHFHFSKHFIHVFCPVTTLSVLISLQVLVSVCETHPEIYTETSPFFPCWTTCHTGIIHEHLVMTFISHRK